MNRSLQALRVTVFSLLIFAVFMAARSASTQAPAATPAPGLLNRTEAAAILPDKVFFHGQSAGVQGRNSGGVRLADGKLILLAIVDTAGYSSAIQQTYQAYLLTEVPLRINDKTLAPGAYGFGFVAKNSMVVMDIGGNELLRAGTVSDAALARPTPLQLVADPASPNRYRLYLGRSYVTLSPSTK
jgi:hypothetical protein